MLTKVMDQVKLGGVSEVSIAAAPVERMTSCRRSMNSSMPSTASSSMRCRILRMIVPAWGSRSRSRLFCLLMYSAIHVGRFGTKVRDAADDRLRAAEARLRSRNAVAPQAAAAAAASSRRRPRR